MEHAYSVKLNCRASLVCSMVVMAKWTCTAINWGSKIENMLSLKRECKCT